MVLRCFNEFHPLRLESGGEDSCDTATLTDPRSDEGHRKMSNAWPSLGSIALIVQKIYGPGAHEAILALKIFMTIGNGKNYEWEIQR